MFYEILSLLRIGYNFAEIKNLENCRSSTIATSITNKLIAE